MNSLSWAAGSPKRVGEPKSETIRPLEVIELDLGHRRLGPFVMLAPRALATDHLLGGKLCHTSQADLGSGILGALDDRLGHRIDVTGRRAVDDCDLAHAKTVIRANRARISQWTVRLGSPSRAQRRLAQRTLATTGQWRMRVCRAGLMLTT
jgi:hypothetical protein